MNGSGAFPPTTLSGSFPASSAPVQASTKPAKSPDTSNSHRIPTETSPVEVMEKPIQKTKEKASSLTWILPQLQNMDKLKMINKNVFVICLSLTEVTKEDDGHLWGKPQ